MRKIILGCALVGLTIGCAKIRTDGTMIEYSRFGTQKLTDLTFTKTADGDLSMSLGSQESTDLQKALETLNLAVDKLPSYP